MSHATISFIILGAAVVLFVINRLPPELVAVGAALALYAAGVLTSGQVAAGFGDPAVVFIASLFIVSEGLDASGVTAWAGQKLIAGAGMDYRRLLVSLLVCVAVASALITPNGSVAALIPVAVVMAIRVKRSPSTLLMPLAFSGITGSLLALTGSPVNVIVSEAATESAHHGFGYFSFALVGLPLVAAVIALSVWLGPRLVPKRTARTIPPDLSEHARTLATQYTIGTDVFDRARLPDGLINRESGVAEVVVPPRSSLVGERFFPGMVTPSGDLVVLAVQRKGEDRDGDTDLAVGDTLLLQGQWGALERNLDDSEVLVVDPPDRVRRQAVPLGPGALPAILILLGMVALLASGAVPPFVASLLAAGAMIGVRVVTVEQAYRSISWTAVVLIAAMFAVSVAIKDSGAAEKMARALVDAVGSAGPHVLLMGLFVLTVILGQLISSTATALIMIPVAISAAADIGVSSRPVLMSVAVSSAASFLTPISTPANMMVMGPGGYRFGDYWRLGLCLMAVFFVAATLLVPVIWRF
jgi:di/tricarboxylate transporter